MTGSVFRHSVCLVVLFAAGSVVAQDSPIDILEKKFCKVAHEKTVETMAATTVCKVVAEEVSIPEEMCMPVFEEGWEELAAQCPKNATETLTTALHLRDDPNPVVDLLCKLVKNDEAKTETVQELCTFLQNYIRFDPPKACELILGEGWDYLAQQCPNSVPSEEEKSLIV